MSEPRIVSLLASATEIVCALGFEEALVARSHECDYPVSIKTLPACTESKIERQTSSRDIDDQVKTIVEQGTSVYHVDGVLLKQLQPDFVVTQIQCDVCAASPKDIELALHDWTGGKPNIVSLEPNTLGDVWKDIKNVAMALGTPERGDQLISNLQKRMGAIEAQAGKLDHRPRIVCIEWIDPLMSAGNWIPELVAMAAGENVFGESGLASPWLTWEALIQADPDVILILPCGYDIEESRQNIPILTRDKEWPNLKAVKMDKVFIADGNHYFNRPGPRLAESLEILAEILHPEQFCFNHRGVGWERL